eukprot:gene21513-28496_t
MQVADFGLARRLDASEAPIEGATEMEGDRDPIGTLAYMAPEAMRGTLVKGSDVYSFGIMLWQFCSGLVPFQPANWQSAELVQEHVPSASLATPADVNKHGAQPVQAKTGQTCPKSGLVPFQGVHASHIFYRKQNGGVHAAHIFYGKQNGSLRLAWPADTYSPVRRLAEMCMDLDANIRPTFEQICKALLQIETRMKRPSGQNRPKSSGHPNSSSTTGTAAPAVEGPSASNPYGFDLMPDPEMIPTTGTDAESQLTRLVRLVESQPVDRPQPMYCSAGCRRTPNGAVQTNKSVKVKKVKALLEPSLNSEVHDGQNKFARALGSTDYMTREKGLQALQRWMQRQPEIQKEDMMKIWKGLFYCFWMSDKAPVQAELAQRFADLLPSFNTEMGFTYFSAFVGTMRREWFGIDRLRLDKFLLLVRMFLASMFTTMANKKWDLEIVQLYMDFLRSSLLIPEGNSTMKVLGLTYHIADIFITELLKSSVSSNIT